MAKIGLRAARALRKSGLLAEGTTLKSVADIVDDVASGTEKPKKKLKAKAKANRAYGNEPHGGCWSGTSYGGDGLTDTFD